MTTNGTGAFTVLGDTASGICEGEACVLPLPDSKQTTSPPREAQRAWHDSATTPPAGDGKGDEPADTSSSEESHG
jgi:hypothetical protein